MEENKLEEFFDSFVEDGSDYQKMPENGYIKVGDVVEFSDTKPMLKFRAKNLKLEFPVLLFVPGVRKKP